ncbi:MAG: hydroxymethylpyrimidine/phosphomethylpyrimidine kinase [Gammaproteobacteria bacterium]|nr:hydroxymethylpyrimidine/phosphomethylpyrimidine kinase [Gammaproteobacteria bacterium]
MHPVPPNVLVISGNDPSGGAGMTADIQAITALSAHPAPVITTLTVQDTVNASAVIAVDAGLVTQQAHAVLKDLDIRAIKIGLLGNGLIAQAVADLLRDWPDIPVVLDPVLVAAGGAQLADASLHEVLLQQLLPLTTVLTPNDSELHELAPGDATDAEKAARLIALGTQWLLRKGADADTPEVHNTLYNAGGDVEVYNWSRLPHQFHGSGCTLAAAIAAQLAHGCTVVEAVNSAQRYTFEALRRGYRPGQGQHVPHRYFHLPEAHKKDE